MRKITYEVWELEDLYLFVFEDGMQMYSHSYRLCDGLHDDVMALERGDDPTEWDGNEMLDYEEIVELATLVAMDGELFLRDLGDCGWRHFCDCQTISLDIRGHRERFDSPDALDDWYADMPEWDPMYSAPISNITVGGLKCDEMCLESLVRDMLK